jgi:PAS domain S-box-containing protein
MSEQLQILILEDRPTDAELMTRELRREGIEFTAQRVMTEAEFEAALHSPALDLILSDYKLPAYDGLSALALARKLRPEVPFIFVSGSIGEEIAIDALHHGATDYILKQRLDRLGPAVRRTLLAARDQKRLAEATRQLAESEKRLRLALEAGQMGVWEIDLVNGTAWRTPRHDQIFGYEKPPTAWNYDILLEHVVLEDRETVKHAFARASSTDNLSFECRIARAGQEPRWIAMQGRVSRNEKGERVRLMGTVSDISERRLLEKTSRENERRFRLLADNADDMIWTTDAAGLLNYVSPSVQRLLGYQPAEVLARGMERALTAASATMFREKLDRVIPRMQAGSQERDTFELHYIRKDGWTIWCEVSCSGMFDAGGGFAGIVGVTRDISERRRAEEALRESEEKHRLLFETSQDAMMTGEPPSWKFTSGNAAALKMFAVKDEEQFVSLGPWNLSPERQPDGRASSEKAREMIEVAMRAGSHFFEWTHRRLDGEVFPATVLLSRIKSGERMFLQATVRDITENKRAEESLRRHAEELRARNEEMDRFNRASVGRELRMIELKEEVNQLCGQAGLPPRYPLHATQTVGKPGPAAPPAKPGQS